MRRREFLKAAAATAISAPCIGWPTSGFGEAETWTPEPELLESLDNGIPRILESQRPNGQFGREPWICRDQNLVFPLAAAWHLKQSKHYQSEAVLDAVVKGGHALIDAQDSDGKWIFRKKDNSTWGMIHMPWTYSRWIRAYSMVREAMDAKDRTRWNAGLQLGYEEIARGLRRPHNIPCHHAMGLYCAGQVFERDDWRQKAQDFMQKVVAEQSPHGWWSEHVGPVVGYNFVYSDALGVYYRMSGDDRVLEALGRAARFHAAYTYPDGSSVETVDERNPYSGRIRLGNPGFSHSAAGRGYLRQQHGLHLSERKRFSTDYAANMLLYASSGPVEETAGGRDRLDYRMGDRARVVRKRPWFISLSAFTADVTKNRWIQDRQNFVSLFHDDVGMVIGGGNTKMQPLWSTFTVGDTELLSHTPGESKPDFIPDNGLIHVPDRAELVGSEDRPGVRLHYGEEVGAVTILPVTDRRARMVWEATSRTGLPVKGHVTLVVDHKEPVRFSNGNLVALEPTHLDQPFPEEGWIEHSGWRLSIPEGCRLMWPARRHNPYRKGGESGLSEARMVLELPFSQQIRRYDLELEIL
jgi:hypothetical protein